MATCVCELQQVYRRYRRYAVCFHKGCLCTVVLTIARAARAARATGLSVTAWIEQASVTGFDTAYPALLTPHELQQVYRRYGALHQQCIFYKVSMHGGANSSQHSRSVSSCMDPTKLEAITGFDTPYPVRIAPPTQHPSPCSDQPSLQHPIHC